MVPLLQIADLAKLPGPITLGIGVFDGVHVGHQAVIAATLSSARSNSGTPVIVTFDPHPARVLRPDAPPRLLTSTSHKVQLLEDCGVRHVLLVSFNADFAKQSPEEFVGLLAKHCRPLTAICVGEEWAFGRNRAGNVTFLSKLGKSLGFTTVAVPPVKIDSQTVSSTAIRQAVEAGRLEEAARFLGRPFTILGDVVGGRKIGRTLGFPTANLSAHNEQFPPNGVYAVRAKLGHRFLNGVANIGLRPTVENAAPERKLEVHLLDLEEDIYGEEMEISFEGFLRPEVKFASLEDLQTQIKADVQAARKLLVA